MKFEHDHFFEWMELRMSEVREAVDELTGHGDAEDLNAVAERLLETSRFFWIAAGVLLAAAESKDEVGARQRPH